MWVHRIYGLRVLETDLAAALEAVRSACFEGSDALVDVLRNALAACPDTGEHVDVHVDGDPAHYDGTGRA